MANDLLHDAFLSYRHLDNLGPDGQPGAGWVTTFHQRLAVKLGEHLGRLPRIWRDPRLDGNDVFADEIADQVRQSAVLIPVVSPGYRQSDWCRREFDTFKAAADAGGRWRLGNKVAALKVVRLPLPDDEHQSYPVDALGYWFFAPDQATGRPMRFEAGSEPYERRIDEVAQDLAEFLARLRTHVESQQKTGPAITRPAPQEEVVLGCEVFGLVPRAPVLGVACVVTDDPRGLTAQVQRFKESVVIDPAFTADSTLPASMGRDGLHFASRSSLLRVRIAEGLATMPWDGYVSLGPAALFAGRPDEDVVVELLRGVLWDRLRGFAERPVRVVLGPRLGPHVQGVSEAATRYRRELTATDGVSVVGASTIAVATPGNAAAEVAAFLGELCGARAAAPTSVEAEAFLRVYPNKVRLIHDLGRRRHYSRRQPLAPGEPLG